MPSAPTPLIDRALAKVMPEPNSGCWLWTASLDSKGYGQINAGSCNPGKIIRAHRLIYEMHKGPVPEGMDLDHICRVRSCVNPDHLEPVTRAVNLRRGDGPRLTRERHLAKTECPNGHRYVEGVSYRVQNRSDRTAPNRHCLICAKANAERNNSGRDQHR